MYRMYEAKLKELQVNSKPLINRSGLSLLLLAFVSLLPLFAV